MSPSDRETENDYFEQEWKDCHKDVEQEKEVIERHFGPDRVNGDK